MTSEADSLGTDFPSAVYRHVDSTVISQDESDMLLMAASLLLDAHAEFRRTRTQFT
ncbi:hypothetical protein ACSL103130_01170 [Actinomyces slackii]|uniref:Uncharacterized protein n=1 Tax=Actinomyces slackii TaxID=52774 RepID=A0A448KAU3_9ACTO|nr:Uncharacterised protein [Actinomyces slackii]